MKHTYTRLVQSKVDEINTENLSSPDFIHDLGDNTEELKKLVNEFNRTFSDGLSLLLKYSSYDGDLNNLEEKRAFIRAKLKSIGISKDEKTIFNWLKGATEPDANEKTRDRIYRLCFALSVSTDVVNWFFNHVYFQRSFNCRRLEEAVYYYCFKNNYDYEHAQQLISEIQTFPKQEVPDPDTIFYTTEIQQQLDHCSTDEDLKQYFRTNKWTFQENQANQHAEKVLRELLEKIQGKETDRAIAEKVKEGKIIYAKDLREIADCGLIVQEVLSLDEPHKPDFKEEPDPHSLLNCLLCGNDISSISIMLKCIYGRLGSEDDIHTEEINLPAKRRENFPSEKVFSDLHLQKGELYASKNYDAIRKCLILLTFYQFWCECKLHSSDLPSDNSTLYKMYESETNDYLTKCGYDILNPVNSYDRLFMLCSGSATPLEAFRNFLSSTT